jgi:hypothetical protein
MIITGPKANKLEKKIYKSIGSNKKDYNNPKAFFLREQLWQMQKL